MCYFLVSLDLGVKKRGNLRKETDPIKLFLTLDYVVSLVGSLMFVRNPQSMKKFMFNGAVGSTSRSQIDLNFQNKYQKKFAYTNLEYYLR